MGASDAEGVDPIGGRRREGNGDLGRPPDPGSGGRHFGEFADRTPLVVLALDERGVVTYANPSLLALGGGQATVAVGRDGLRWLFGIEEPEPRARHADVLRGSSASYVESEVTSPTGRMRTLGWHTVPVHSPRGAVVGSLSVGADLTARLRSTAARDAVDEIERSILTGRSIAALERQVCESAREVTGTAFAILARPGPRGCRVRAAAGLDITDLLDAPVATPWCGTGETDAGPIELEDLELPGAIRERVGPTAAVPLAPPPSCGFLLVADPPDAPPLESYVVDVVGTYARQANIALEYGSRVRELAVLEDRERIAKDLHDLVIQRIFAAGLSLQVAAQMSIDQPEVAERLSDVSRVLDGAITELRRSILGLESPEERMLGRRVEDLVVEVTDGADLDVVVEVPEGPAGISETLIGHLLAALREALTNVVRHARADRVEVVVTVGDSLVLAVRDDGVGLSTGGEDGHGLRNLADRARRLGGAFHVDDAPGGGVVLEWRVPVLTVRTD